MIGFVEDFDESIAKPVAPIWPAMVEEIIDLKNIINGFWLHWTTIIIL